MNQEQYKLMQNIDILQMLNLISASVFNHLDNESLTKEHVN